MPTELEVAAAMMLARGDQPEEIVKALGIKRYQVPILKGRAIAAGILTPRSPRFERNLIKDEKLLEAAKRLVHDDARELRKTLQQLTARSLLRRIFVFSSGPATEDLTARRRIFGRAAAPVVWELMRRSSVVAVSYGETVSSIIDGMDDMDDPKRPAAKITFVPLRGDPIGERRGVRTSPTNLAYAFREAVDRINGGSKTRRPEVRPLAGVPPIIPSNFSSREAATVRKYAMCSGVYKDLFGPSRGIRKADCILTAAGATGRFGIYSSAYFQTWGRDEWVSKHVMGDMAGYLIPAKGDTSTMQAQRDWLGIQPEDWRAIAARHASKKSPGVIVAASGGTLSLAEVLYECIVTLNVINYLLLDHQTFRHLENLAQKAAAIISRATVRHVPAPQP